ncbi:MAG TPA: helix-turn-helix transcriptional regulator [Puia sp.]|nr:helix-turn-helix transcriptional regulator [Puia sp.]
MNIGKAIRQLRKEKGLNQIELATKANLTQTALSQIENGKRPGILTLQNIAAALEVSEPLIYLLSTEISDVPESRKDIYEKLFPVVESLIIQIATEPNKKV